MEEEINKAVRAIIAAAAHEIPALLLDVHLYSMATRQHIYPLHVSIRLRDSGHLERSKMVLLASLSVPDQRPGALYETAVALSRQGRAAESLAALLDKQAEFGLSTYQVPLLAVQFARLGKFPEAEEALYAALDRDGSFQNEFSITYDFVRFLQQFPQERAETFYHLVKSLYRDISVAEIEAEIAAALGSGRPYLLLRSGDGEGTHTRISPEDDRSYADLYRSNRAEFHQIWFAHLNHMQVPAWTAVMDGYDCAVEAADCWGGFDLNGIHHEYRIASRRGIHALVNLLRAARAHQRRNPAKAALTSSTSGIIHYALLTSGALERLLIGAKWIGLVSCHPALPEALARRFNIQHVEFYKVPGEVGRRQILGEETGSGEHFPARYESLCAELEMAQAGRLYLVAAGLLGKTYCKILKQAGGIVIDIGAVADLWMGKKTRDFPMGDYALVD